MADLTNNTLSDTSPPFYQINFIVRGHVIRPDNTTVAGITVKAFDKDIEQEKVIGTTVSDANGRYIIRFTSQDLARPNKPTPDLIVRGYDSEFNLVAASPLITGVTSADEIVILRIGTIDSPEPPIQEPPVMVDSDRLEILLEQNRMTGIDFIYVHEGQRHLDVHFFVSPEALEHSEDESRPLIDDLTHEQVLIYCPTGRTTLSPVPIVPPLHWIEGDEGYYLRIETARPGDFTIYRLRIDHPRVDPFFNDITFSFKANCESRIDCRKREHECPEEELVDFPVDYTARDFWSFRSALLEFATLRYPDWKDRLEADAGIMLTEVMSAMGDEMAYYQDRIAREAFLETAIQRRSLRRHSRLVDYHVHDGLAASTWLDVTVRAGESGSIPAGMDVWATGDSGEMIYFEAGRGLNEIINKVSYDVDSRRNSFRPHIWDEYHTCLCVGSTELFIKGHHETDLPFDDLPDGKEPGKWALLKTSPTDPSIPERSWMVRLIRIEDFRDEVLDEDITRVVWEKEQATPFEMDFMTLEVRANLVPVTEGRMSLCRFVIGADPAELELPVDEKAKLVRAVERQGPNKSIAYLFSLPGSGSRPLAWLGQDPRNAFPEIRLVEDEYEEEAWVEQVIPWIWRRSFLGTSSSNWNDSHFTLEDGTWGRVAGYQRAGNEIVHTDYASGFGNTIRFGDGEFGMIPKERTIFKVMYRLGSGQSGNMASGTLTHFDENSFGFIERVTNPLSIENGMDAETDDDVRQSAPEAFRHVTFRAVRPDDYAEAAERLSWVQRAGAAFRWTGSWLTAFVTPDPVDAVSVSDKRRNELIEHLDRFRQAGRQVYALDPNYADLDLKITICVKPDAYKDQVRERVLEILFGKKGIIGSRGFFSSENFTFGTPLDRPALEAKIQSVPGVRAVKGILIRRRGWYDWKDFTELSEAVDKNEIIRVENDPLHPESGSLLLIMEGGA